MMHEQTIEAVFKEGTFRPLTSVSLSEGQQVQLVVRTPASPGEVLELATCVYEGLSQEQIQEVEQIAQERDTFFGDEIG